ncbi:MAG: hypothetical protein ACK5LZ_02690 [Anaerorhabdus sp.]
MFITMVVIFIIIIALIMFYCTFKRIDHLLIEYKLIQNKLYNIDKNIKFIIEEKNRKNITNSYLCENEDEELDKLLSKEELTYNPIFSGKKALIGNYNSFSAEVTKEKLCSLGIEVDIVQTGDEIIEKINAGESYDIIFTNNIYKQGNLKYGKDVLCSLKSLEEFNIPIIVHTIEFDKRNYFLNELKFDEYLEKGANIKKFEKILINIFKF